MTPPTKWTSIKLPSDLLTQINRIAREMAVSGKQLQHADCDIRNGNLAPHGVIRAAIHHFERKVPTDAK